MANRLFGIADPYYDALRVQSNQAIWPDAGGGSGSTGGVGLENKVYLWPSDGSTITTFDPDEAGLIAALAAASSGDTVWLPSITISVTAALVLPAGVMVCGIDQNAILSRAANNASDIVTMQGPTSGIAYLSHITILCTQSGSGGSATALAGDAGQISVRDSYINGTAPAGTGYSVRSADGLITLDDCYLVGSTAPLQGAGGSYAPGGQISTGAVTVASSAGDTIGGLSIGNWYCIETYDAFDRWPAGGSSWTNEFSLSNDGGSVWSGRFGANNLADSSASTAPGTGYSTSLPTFAPFGEFWGTPATRPRVYFQATTTSVLLRVYDTFWGDNVGAFSWRLRAATAGGGTGLNIITHGVRMQPVEGEPALGDRSAWDTLTWFDRHASDIADQTFTYHLDPNNPQNAPAANISPIEVSIDGRLAVVSDILPGYLVTEDRSIESASIRCTTKGTASSTIVDVNRNGATIFTTQANRPSLAYNGGAFASGTPDIIDLIGGDVLTFDIDQIATAAERLTIVLALSAAISSTPPQVSIDASKIGSTTDNIVLSLGAGGTFDSAQALGPYAIEYGGTIYLYYGGFNGSVNKIGVATAPVAGFTGVNFTKYGSNPILSTGTAGAWDDSSVHNPWVIYDAEAGLWKMWYRGLSGGVNKIGYATAPAPLGPWTKYGGNPVLSPAGWEGSQVLLPSVLRESATSYKMLYAGNEPASGDGRIGLATSTDGISWTKYAGNPVLSPSGSGWMAASVFSPRTLIKSGGTYYLMFSAKQSGAGASKCGAASSTDLITWTLNASNPLLTATRAWEGSEVENPNVLRIGHDQYIFYDAWFGSPSTIGVAKVTIP